MKVLLTLNLGVKILLWYKKKVKVSPILNLIANILFPIKYIFKV